MSVENITTPVFGDDGIIRSSFLPAGTGGLTIEEVKADADIADSLYKKHSNSPDHAQGTDQGLDTGGTSAVTAAQAKTAYTHSQTAHAPSNAQANADITKAEIEAKLTGELSSHTHAGGAGTPDISYYRRTGATRERWFTCPTTATAMTVSTALTANRIYAHPFIVAKTITLDRIAINCTTLVASGNLILGIYADSNGEPGSRILDAGEVSTATTGIKSLTISQQLTPSLYWLAAASKSATHAFRVPAIAATINVCGVGSTLGTAIMTHFYAAFTYAALPPTFPTVTEGTSLVYPAIFVRLSA